MWAPPYVYADELRQKAPGYTPLDQAVAENDPELEAELKRVEGRLETADEEGLPLYSSQAFNRARTFLTDQTRRAMKMYKSFLPVPEIGPGPDRSIDLHWKTPRRELLINISPDKPAVYYGDDYGVRKIKGSLDPATWDLGIILWLMRDQINSL